MKINDRLINILTNSKDRALLNEEGEAIGIDNIGDRIIYLNTAKKGCVIPWEIARHDETWDLVHRDDLKMLDNKRELNNKNTGKIELGENTIWFSPKQLIIQTKSISLVKEAIEIWVKNVYPKR